MNGSTIETEPVRLQRDAHGARCADCGTVFNVTTCPFWHWSKSAGMHRESTGHRVAYYRIAA